MDPRLLLQPFDGHAPYVWGSLLMCALVIALELLALRWRRRAALAALRDEAGTATGLHDSASGLAPPRQAPVLTRMPARGPAGGPAVGTEGGPT